MTKPELTLTQAVLDEIERLHDAGELEAPTVEPRCYVCCEVQSRDLVNKLIGQGYTNRQITESCAVINAEREAAEDKRIIGARTVWEHRRAHFNVQDPAMAAIREVVERRAKANNRDFLNGIGHAITPYAVVETTMVRGFQGNLANPELDPPTIKETLEAAKMLHQMETQEESGRDIAQMMATMDRIISAADKFIPTEFKEAFIAEVEGTPLSKPLAVLAERVQDQAEKVVKTFSPSRTMDDGDEI